MNEETVSKNWIISEYIKVGRAKISVSDSIRSLHLDPDSESGSGSRSAKMTHKKRKKVKKHVSKCWMFSFED